MDGAPGGPAVDAGVAPVGSSDPSAPEDPSSSVDPARSAAEDAFLRLAARAPAVPPPEPPESLVGRRLGRYRVASVLGKGGMGTVYRAVDETLGRAVALKVLPARLAGAGFEARLLREARAAALSAHPSIAAIHDVGAEGERLFLAMELVEGRTLRAALAGGPPPLEEAVRVGRAIAGGLVKAHEAGVVHRDLKPDNVMIAEDGAIKILDFGLAKPFGVAGSRLAGEGAAAVATEEGRILGTPGYMSPEQARGLAVDARSDLFSLGVLLHEMVTGERPFRGPTALDVLVATQRDEPPRPSSLRAGVPAALDALIVACLRKEPADRPPSSRAVLEALERIDVAADAPAGKPGRPARGRLAVAAVAAVAASIALGALGIGALAPGNLGQPNLGRPNLGRSNLSPNLGQPNPNLGQPNLGQPNLGQGWPAPAPEAARSPAAEAPPPPPGTTLATMPDPARCTPAAAADVRLGRAGLRQGGWEQARLHFRRAAAADPGCPEAHLRLAQTGFFSSASEARRAFQRARELREALPERDRRLLDALAPLLLEDPPDFSAFAAGARQLAARFPDDAEIALTGAWMSPDPLEQRALALRAVALDPGYADGWQTVARAAERLGDEAAKMAALDRCIAAAPGAVDCLRDRFTAHQRAGRCESAEADARRWTASAPDTAEGFFHLGSMFVARGGPRDAALEALGLRWSRLRGDEGWMALHERAKLAVVEGDLAAAERLARELGAEVADDAERLPHGVHALFHVDLLEETGRRAEAAEVAAAYLRRKDAWAARLGVDETLSGLHRTDPWLERAARRAAAEGAPTHGSAPARKGAPALDPRWTPRWRARFAKLRESGLLTAADLWALTEAAGVASAADAALAVRAMPAELRGAPRPEQFGRDAWTVQAFAGRALSMAGEHAAAVPLLRAVADACIPLDEPFVHVWASAWLGEALEASGDTAGACAAYGRVLERWGTAERSRSAARARLRRRQLGCR
ncbi:protein kinase [Sorangium cellulosum]|uniref:protein kinase domain-containing protein n=1 Tax=Sorangium cellulosum TaxID=56 RepID=UPI003D9A9B93